MRPLTDPSSPDIPGASRRPWWKSLLLAPFYFVFIFLTVPIYLIVLSLVLLIAFSLMSVDGLRARRDDRRLRRAMLSAGRTISWQAIEHDLARGPGTLLIEYISVGWHHIRLWWTPESLARAGAPPIIDCMTLCNQNRPDLSFIRWTCDRYTDPQHGRALLLTTLRGERATKRLRATIDALHERFPHLETADLHSNLLDLLTPCTRCGYSLEGLDADTPCPECGLQPKLATEPDARIPSASPPPDPSPPLHSAP